jgi:hypothetical protein
MTKQIKKISPHQTAKVLAIITAIMTLPVTVSFLITANSPSRAPLVFSLAVLLLYPVASYVLVAIGCWLYNVMFKYIGGIEIEFNDE